MPYIDKNELPIYPGDLLRSFHFKDAIRRQKRYLYHVVKTTLDGELECVPYIQILGHRVNEGGICSLDTYLRYAIDIEILDGDPYILDRKKIKIKKD